MSRERGLTLLECLVALALLALVLTMSFTVLERHRLLVARMDARLSATRAAEYELESLLATPFERLRPCPESPATTHPPELDGLEQGRMTHEISDTGIAALRRVRVQVRFARDGGAGVVAEALIFGGTRGHAPHSGARSAGGRGR